MPGAQPVILRPDEGVPPPTRTGRGRLSPLNRRRLDNFRRNRLGYVSFLIFAGLFVLSLFAEFIANDRPIVLSYKGEWLVPVLVDYPEEKFGGFLAVTDYRRPVSARRSPRMAGRSGRHPVLLRHDQQGPADALARRRPPGCSRTRSAGRSPRARPHTCARHPGTGSAPTSSGRDVLARLIYGFRISVLFGLILAAIWSVARRDRRAPSRAISAAGPTWSSSASSRSGASMPQLYLLIISRRLRARLLRAARHPAAVRLDGAVGYVRAEFLRARNFDYVSCRPRARRRISRIMWRTSCRTP